MLHNCIALMWERNMGHLNLGLASTINFLATNYWAYQLNDNYSGRRWPTKMRRGLSVKPSILEAKKQNCLIYEAGNMIF